MDKREIYLRMITSVLQYIRYIQSLDKKIKGKDISCYYEANLVHNLCYSVLNPDFEAHDIHFLNYQARNYIEDCNENISLNYNQHVKYIKELFKLVPLELRSQLLWSGPETSS
ncbi:hypothetical protein PT273_01155 [Orbaceae bacterium ESL0727]|nr:hypothetical protein [Orbaceae bacterium ESL0727]